MALFALWPAGAAALPGHGPREDIDQRFTSQRPHSASGVSYTGVYHAADKPKGNPPYLVKMIFYPPKGTRYDTSVPAKCTATDAQLMALGKAACPAASRIGGGRAQGIFYEPVAQSFIFDRYDHTMDVLNNTNEQILLVNAEGSAVERGTIRPDGTILFTPQTCFPEPPTGCVNDYILQRRSATTVARYTRAVNGRTRSYVTTPPRCPASGYWKTTVKFWWKGGAVDTVVSKQPCRRG
ncbi:MAG TPA: hypothetical protein VJT75_01735 [Thermoleophilaceae bacterium]|nr:hypothetical protein [Thermoleophilaceae bacterium]